MDETETLREAIASGKRLEQTPSLQPAIALDSAAMQPQAAPRFKVPLQPTPLV